MIELKVREREEATDEAVVVLEPAHGSTCRPVEPGERRPDRVDDEPPSGPPPEDPLRGWRWVPEPSEVEPPRAPSRRGPWPVDTTDLVRVFAWARIVGW